MSIIHQQILHISSTDTSEYILYTDDNSITVSIKSLMITTKFDCAAAFKIRHFDGSDAVQTYSYFNKLDSKLLLVQVCKVKDYLHYSSIPQEDILDYEDVIILKLSLHNFDDWFSLKISGIMAVMSELDNYLILTLIYDKIKIANVDKRKEFQKFNVGHKEYKIGLGYKMLKIDSFCLN